MATVAEGEGEAPTAQEIVVYEKDTNRLILSTQAPNNLEQLEGAIGYLEGREVLHLTVRTDPSQCTSQGPSQPVVLDVTFGYRV